MKHFLFSFSLILFLLTLPIFILSFLPITRMIYHFTGAQRNQPLELSTTSEDLLKQTLDYMFNAEKNYSLRIPDSISIQLTVNEQSHMNDVKHLFFLAKMVLLTSFLMSSFIGVTTKPIQRKDLFVNTFRIMKYFFPIVILLSLATFFFWGQTFTLFHEVFFPQGNWAFPENSLIIQLFPDQFWWGMGVGYIWLAGSEFGGFWVISKKLIKEN